MYQYKKKFFYKTFYFSAGVWWGAKRERVGSNKQRQRQEQENNGR